MLKKLLFSFAVMLTSLTSFAQSVEVTSPRYVGQGSDNLTVKYSGAPVGTDAWIGVYADGTRPGAGDSYAWAYTTGDSGTLTFSLRDWNSYYVVLFADGGYSEIARSKTVLACNDYTLGESFEMTTDKAVYKEGEPVVVTLKNAPAFNKDWLGIYEEGQTPGVDGAESSSYVYVDGANTTLTLNSDGTLQYGAPAVKPGRYYVTYLLWDGYSEVFERTYFTVEEASSNDETWSFVWDTSRSNGGEGFYNISDHSKTTQVETLNGLEWTLESNSYATGYTATSGQYFGSSANPITHGTLSTPYLHGKIKSVSFEAKTKDAAQDVKVTVSVGGVNYGEPVSLTTDKTVYTCTPTGDPQEGDIVFTFDQTSETKSIIYFYSMSIVYDGEGVVAPSVEKVSPELSFSPTELTIESGDYTVNPVVNPHNVSGITYSSSDNDIALVGVNNGMVVSMGPAGTCTITATFPGDDHYLPQTVSYTLTVVEKPVIAAPEVDVKGGKFDAPVIVTITSDDPLCKAIWYSTTLTNVDDMGWDDETIIVPGKTAQVTIDHSCTLLCVAVGDNNIGLPASYEFEIGVTDGVTGVTADSNAADAIYNINGQRLSSLQRGVNIVGGKVIIVK